MQAAVTVARRVAWEKKVELGQEVRLLLLLAGCLSFAWLLQPAAVQ